MKDILLFFADYLKGKSIFPLLRAFLNTIFCISISNYLFSKTYPSLSLPNLLDYQKIIDFCISGYFFIPFAIFLIVFFITQGVTVIVFNVYNYYKNIRLMQIIIAYEIKKNEIEESLQGIELVSKHLLPINLTKEKLTELYLQLRNHITEKEISDLQAGIDSGKTTLTDNFTMGFRGIIAVTIYYLTIPEFGFILYGLTFTVLIIYLFILFISYKFLDLLPTLIRKLTKVADNYLQSDQ